MAFSDLALSFLAFPQEWKPGSIEVHFLVLSSSGDPLQPLIPAGPQFAGTAYSFKPYFIPGLDALPDLSVPPVPLNSLPHLPSMQHWRKHYSITSRQSTV